LKALPLLLLFALALRGQPCFLNAELTPASSPPDATSRMVQTRTQAKLQNVGKRPIVAYTLLLQHKDADGKVTSRYFASAFFGAVVKKSTRQSLLPGEATIDPLNNLAIVSAIDTPEAEVLTIGVDYVRYADGSACGKDLSKTGAYVAGLIAGQNLN
jgi:hypothetical protein